jgi:hypothetical protein
MRYAGILIILLLSFSLTQATTLVDGFSGTALSSGWEVTSGSDSNYNVSGGKLNITNTIGGTLLGPWSMFRTRHTFQTQDDFEIDIRFNYIRESYKIFTVSLLDSVGNQKLQMRIWDSPTNWVISGYNDSTWWITNQTSLTPSRAQFQRIQDTISLIWDGNVQAKGFWPENTSYIEITVGDFDASLITVGIDSIYATSTPHTSPSSPIAQTPDNGSLPLFNMLPTFDWSAAIDPDPFDTVLYKLEISLNAGFSFVNTIDSITASEFSLTDSLEFNKHYWWRVTAFDTDGLSAQSGVKDFWTWTLGDVNHSHSTTVADLTYMVQFLFNGGQPISPLFVGDLNSNCTVTIQDLVYLVQFLFNNGSAPKVGCEP